MATCGSTVWVILTLTLGLMEPLSLVWSSACPSICTCRYKGGKETAECAGERLISVPTGLSKGTQVLDISKNNLKQLTKEVFYLSGLRNLQKLYIAECKIRKIDDEAFSHLANLVELNLEGNLLIAVPSETFEDYPELRKLILNKNPIRRIETSAFVKLPYLSELEMSNCFVEYVGPRAFIGLEVLQDLRLDGNQLTTLPADVGFPIKSLRNLQVYDNPWACDCHLRVFRNWLVEGSLPVSAAPVCSEPKRLHGRVLNHILPEEFACAPHTSPYQDYVTEAYTGEGAKLVCNVHSDPPASITWFYKGKMLGNNSKGANGKTYTMTERGGLSRISVLNFFPISDDDSGDYLCIAENFAGQIIINITLEVVEKTAEASSLSNGHIAGISIGLIIISVVTVVFIFILLTKMRRQNQQSEERKHLELVDKKQSVHLMNHTGGVNSYEINKKDNKTRLPLTPNNENSSFVKKSLVTNSSNALYNNGGGGGGTPTTQEMLRLEDSIGGSLIRSSSRMSSTKPDVVNFTCSNGASSSPDDIFSSAVGVGVAATISIPVSMPVQDNQMKCSSSLSKISPVIENIKDSIRLMTTSSSKESAFLLTERHDSRERLCEYVQLYEEVEQGGKSGAESASKVESESTLRGSGSGECTNKTVEPNNQVKTAKNGVRISNGSNHQKQRYGPLGNACGGILKHVNLHGRNYVPVLPPLPINLQHFAQTPDEGYEDEVEEEMDT